jgi:hypothetical protein
MNDLYWISWEKSLELSSIDKDTLNVPLPVRGSRIAEDFLEREGAMDPAESNETSVLHVNIQTY